MILDAKLKRIAPVVLRIGMSLVVLWFGYEQVTDVNSWLGFLPTWTADLPISQVDLIYLNGIFEIVFGLFLLAGFYTRFVALMLALHLLDITYTVGYSAIGVRDLGLGISTFAIFFLGSDSACIDRVFGGFK